MILTESTCTWTLTFDLNFQFSGYMKLLHKITKLTVLSQVVKRFTIKN